MPKPFSGPEKAKIREQLQQAGIKRFAQAGVRAVRIEDVCRDIGIAKGSFYAFFESKEDLFMTVADERDIRHKADMLDYLDTTAGDARSVLNGFFDFMLERIETDPVLKIVRDSGEINHLIRKLPAERLMENTRRDHAFMFEAADRLHERFGLEHATAITLEGLLTLMLSLSLQDEHLKSGGIYRTSINLMRDLFLSRLIRGPLND